MNIERLFIFSAEKSNGNYQSSMERKVWAPLAGLFKELEFTFKRGLFT
jgi:hypothetical protein